MSVAVGQDKYRTVTESFYRDADGVILGIYASNNNIYLYSHGLGN
jgi:GTPase SAR1 family protein